MADQTTRLLLGDAQDRLAELGGASVDALVTDPPAGISFMGKAFDSDRGGRDLWIEWLCGVMQLAYMVLKPGAHGLVWALPRTSHWTATALEDAGFEIRDVVMHVFGSGFPKSLNIGSEIDKRARGAERGKPDPESQNHQAWAPVRDRHAAGSLNPHAPGVKPSATRPPATPDAQRWHGWGTALKPAAEHWILVRKPLVGTVAANVLEYGTGGINVSACRVESGGTHGSASSAGMGKGHAKTEGHGIYHGVGGVVAPPHPAGRWPPHLLLTHSPDCADRCVAGCPVREMDGQSGERPGMPVTTHRAGTSPKGYGMGVMPDDASVSPGFGDSGGASRFFPRFRYQPKPSRAEREAGCEHLPARSGAEAVDREEGSAGVDNPRAGAGRTASEIHNHHPTLKSLDLMRWLVRLITPPGGTVLDPFMGSGTTGMAAFAEGMSFVGIEQDHDYMALAQARIEWASSQTADVDGPYERPKPQFGQIGLFEAKA